MFKVKKRKNVKSKKTVSPNRGVPIGRTIKTKDKYLPYDEKKSKALKDKRWVVVVDKNTNEELAIVRLTDEKQANTTHLATYKKGNGRDTYFKHFVEIEDKDGNAIRVDDEKFLENAKVYDLSKDEINLIQKVVRGHCKQASANKEKLTKLKQRPKKG